MEQNSSSEDLILIESDPMLWWVKTGIVQVLVWFFIYFDLVMLFTFFSKQAFRSSTRYILFAHTLLADSVFLLITDLVVLLTHFNVHISVSQCVVLCVLMGIGVKNTPYIITAMCLERYVAICMPLRHGSICTIGRTMAAIIVTWAFSSFRVMMDVIIFAVTAPSGYFAKPTSCYYQVMLLTQWHHLMHVSLNQMDFGIIVVIIMFCYTKIMLAAQTASGENKQSVSKGRRTLLLHGLQLILCMADLWSFNIQIVVSQQLYLPIRFFNFIAFTIVSRALSPLIYGIRDKKFCLALKYYMTCKV